MAQLEELLVDELQDLLHAEGQLVRALPKMAKAAHSAKLQNAFESHLEETKGHVERLKQGIVLLGSTPKAKPCKGMAGLVKEGDEVISEGEEKGEASADLSLIAAAQKVEHYEISGYGTARAIAGELGNQNLVRLLTATLEEEAKADELLTAIARPLLSEAAVVESGA